MRKALNRTLDRIYSEQANSPSAPPRSSRPSTATLDLLIAHSSGDIRSALMSLQFLASEGSSGGGHLTSLGTGAKGKGGGAIKGKKGAKKRKRGEEARSSDEEEEGGGTAGKLKNGKDRVRQLWVRFFSFRFYGLTAPDCAQSDERSGRSMIELRSSPTHPSDSCVQPVLCDGPRIVPLHLSRTGQSPVQQACVSPLPRTD